MTIANQEMAAAWDGHEGDVWTEQAERYEAAGPRLWKVFLEDTKAAALEKLHRALAAHQSDEGVLLGSSAWLTTARRR